jgi:hypothetical protein
VPRPCGISSIDALVLERLLKGLLMVLCSCKISRSLLGFQASCEAVASREWGTLRAPVDVQTPGGISKARRLLAYPLQESDEGLTNGLAPRSRSGSRTSGPCHRAGRRLRFQTIVKNDVTRLH